VPAAFAVAPWSLRENGLDVDDLARGESLFALSNGHVGVRGNLDEGEPHALPGTYLNSVYELRPLPYAEGGFGYPESGQSVINVTNGKLIRLLVDDEPFDVRYGRLISHTRELDLRTGILDRQAEWASPSGCRVRVRSQRLVSLTQRSILAIRYEVTPLDASTRIVVQSELVAGEELPEVASDDPRVAAALEHPLLAEESEVEADGGHLVHRTRHSGIRVGTAMQNTFTGPDEVDVLSRGDAADNWVRTTGTVTLEPGQTLRLDKLVAYGWSSRRSLPAVRDQVAGALTTAAADGWEGLAREQQDFLDEFWAGADVEVDGDAELQQAVRVGLFHVLQAGARAERRPIPAKGLTGPGYDGHVFWDTDTFVLPVLTHTYPQAAADVLRWRHSTLPAALARADQLGLEGAAFPWRTITGAECSGYWPAGTAAFHINADIADAVLRYVEATGDLDFDRGIAVELLVHTARLWRSLGHHTAAGSFRIDGVTGPDEYSAIADNNVFTNLMAARNLVGAAAAVARHPDLAALLGVDAEEAASWRDAAKAIELPFSERLGVHEQSEGFTSHAVWDFAATPPEAYPLLLHRPYFELYRKQVVKQADLVLAMQLCGEAFTTEEKRRNFDYYEPLTVRDSSLSAATQAVVAAEVGYLDLAYAYAGEAALMDLHDVHRNTRDGLHIASLAGGWTALVSGFGGMRDGGGILSFCPRLPAGLDRLAFRIVRGEAVLQVEVRSTEASYRLLQGQTELRIQHAGEDVAVRPGECVTRALPHVPSLLGPAQPPGREPRSRTRQP
jgi:alpha,alpha-trehalose phosphorylase